MSATQKKLFAAVIVLIAAAGVYYAMTSRSNGGASTGSASANVQDHPPITEMNGAFGDQQALEEALAQNPTHVPVLLRLGQLALDSGDTDTAVSHLEEALRLQPDSADVRLELGRALYQAGNVERSIEVTEGILDTDPNQVDALYNLGAIHANRNELDQARDYWTRAVAAGPDTVSGTNAQRGLNQLNGQTVATIPDIPEHRGLQTTTPPSSSASTKRALFNLLAEQAPTANGQ